MFKALHINEIKYAFCINFLLSQRTSGGSEELHGQKREIEQLRRQDPIDRSHRRYKDGDDDDTPSQRKGICWHHNDDRNENNDGVDLAYVDLKRGHESHD